MSTEPRFAFVSWLEHVRDSNDQSYARGTLAMLRRGLGKEPGEDANVMRHVVPWLPADAGPWSGRPFFTIASLFALHPQAGGTGDMGSHFRQVQKGKQSAEAVERRFTALLSAHEDELEWHLRQAVSLCKANHVPVNWHGLFRDVRGWSHPNRWVQRNWARSFWGRTQDEDTAQELEAVS